MKGKEELSNLLRNIRNKMAHFDAESDAQNQEMETSLKRMEDNFLESHLNDQPEYFVGRFTVTEQMRTSGFPLAQHIGKEIGISNTSESLVIKSSRDPNFVKVFLNSKGLESHLVNPQSEQVAAANAVSTVPDTINELCNRINLLMITFNQITSKTQFDEQQSGLNQIKDNVKSNKINSQHGYFVGRFSTDREDLKRKIATQTAELLINPLDLRVCGYDMPRFMAVKELTNDIMKDYIAEQIGFGIAGDDLVIEKSSAENMMKVFIRPDGITKCTQYVPPSELKI